MRVTALHDEQNLFTHLPVAVRPRHAAPTKIRGVYDLLQTQLDQCFTHDAGRTPCDIYHAPSYRRIPLCSKVPVIATIHDLAPLHLPEKYGRLRHALLRYWVPFCLRRVAHVLTPTEHTRQDLIKHFAVNPDNVSVTLNGINHQIFKTGTVKTVINYGVQLPHLADDFVLCVGRIEHPAKGRVDMLRAWHRLRSSGHDLPQLVFVGRNCERSSEVWQEADRLGVEVLHLDTVDDVTLARLYAHCRAFVFPVTMKVSVYRRSKRRPQGRS